MTQEHFDIHQLELDKAESAQRKLDDLRALSENEQQALNNAAHGECERIMSRFGKHSRPELYPHA